MDGIIPEHSVDERERDEIPSSHFSTVIADESVKWAVNYHKLVNWKLKKPGRKELGSCY